MQDWGALFGVDFPVLCVGNAPFMAEDFDRIRRLG